MIFGNLSHLPDAVIELVRLALSGKSLVPAETALRVLRSRPHGHVAAVLGTVQSLGIERLLSPRRSPQRDRCIAMIASSPASIRYCAKSGPANAKRCYPPSPALA